MWQANRRHVGDNVLVVDVTEKPPVQRLIQCIAELSVANARLPIGVKSGDLQLRFKSQNRRCQQSKCAAKTVAGDPDGITRLCQSVDGLQQVIPDDVQCRSETAMHQPANDTRLNIMALAEVDAVIVKVRKPVEDVC